MPGYNFTDRLRTVLSLARIESRDLGHEYVGTQHILLGLIREGEGVGAAILTNLGVDVAELRTKIEQTGERGKGTGRTPDLPYTSRAKKVLELAMAESRDLRFDYVGTGQLLLGLLREEKGIAAEALTDCGAQLEIARLELLRLTPPENQSGQMEELESVLEQYPDDNQIRTIVRGLSLKVDALTVLADLDALPPTVIVELLAGLDALHRAWGGSGLRIESEQLGSATRRRVSV
jgi:ATP-dependent Clp protease ATP-binding subunit ClpC